MEHHSNRVAKQGLLLPEIWLLSTIYHESLYFHVLSFILYFLAFAAQKVYRVRFKRGYDRQQPVLRLVQSQRWSNERALLKNIL